jgi:hypothetical protein
VAAALVGETFVRPTQWQTTREASVDSRGVRADRQRADLVVLGRQLDALDSLGAATFAVVARAFGGWPAAIAFLDGLDAARRFVARLHLVHSQAVIRSTGGMGQHG